MKIILIGPFPPFRGGISMFNHSLAKELDKDNQVFHAGTYIKDKKILSNGGRVLNITSSAKELFDARKKILTNLDKIKWDDGFYRRYFTSC